MKLNKILLVAAVLWANTVLAEPGGYLDLSQGATLVATKAGSNLNLGASSTGKIQMMQGQTKLPSFERSSVDNSLVCGTADAADNESMCIGGGGTCSASRGGSVYVYGNENGGTGTVEVISGNDSGSVIQLKPKGDTNRRFKFDAASDTAHTLKFGDSGTTASQTLTLSASTADTDDDSYLCMTGGGDCAATRGAYVVAYGNEHASAGALTLAPGGTADVKINSGNVAMTASGSTIALQEATAGSKCMGSLTCNGASDVVTSTTCAKTGSRIFLTRTSLDADTTGDYYVKSISDNTSFTVACETNDTATLNWIIFHEAP